MHSRLSAKISHFKTNPPGRTNISFLLEGQSLHTAFDVHTMLHHVQKITVQHAKSHNHINNHQTN